MERQSFIKRNWAIILLALIYSVGILGHSLGSFLPLMKDFTPYIMFLTILFVVYITRKDFNKKVIFWAIGTFLLTFAFEAIGVNTGYIFGTYSYGDTLGPKLFNVPLVIGLSWVIVIYAFVTVFNRSEINIFAFVFLVGTSAVAFDFVMEPVAIHLNYWTWQGDIIPIQNYFAWFIVASSSALGYYFLKQEPKSTLPVYLVLIQFIFFLLLNMIVVA